MAEQKRYNPVEQVPQRHFGLVHAFYAMMGGLVFYGSYDDDTPKSLFEISTDPRCTVDVPSYAGFIYIMEHFPHIITDITEEYILDHAASSSLSEALLVVQVAWFCTNCASRLFQRLPLSLLEVSTAAHAFCTLLTYFVWWSKPINVATPTLLREKEAREVHALLKCADNEYDKASEIAQKRAAGDSSTPIGPPISEKIVLAAGALQHLLPAPRRPLVSTFTTRDPMLFPGDIGNMSRNVEFSALTTMAISPMLYSLIHFLAWSDPFPTPLEQLIWHVSLSVVTCSGLIGVFVVLTSFWLLDRIRNSETSLTLYMMGIYITITPLAHVLVSGFLIIESIWQLFFLDNAAYQLPSWSNYWPHLS